MIHKLVAMGEVESALSWASKLKLNPQNLPLAIRDDMMMMNFVRYLFLKDVSVVFVVKWSFYVVDKFLRNLFSLNLFSPNFS